MEFIKTRYISLDEFKQYTGIDLAFELSGEDSVNPSDEANAFLVRVENRISSYLGARFFRNIDREYDRFTQFQKKHYKIGLIEQAYYWFKEGDLLSDSGYTMKEGQKISKGTLMDIAISNAAINEFILCGVWDRNVNDGYWGDFYGWWL